MAELERDRSSAFGLHGGGGVSYNYALMHGICFCFKR